MPPRETTFTDIDLAALRATEAEVTFQMDEDVFRGFYDRTSRPLWGYLVRLTGEPSMADDLLQEAYYRLLRSSLPLESEAHRRHYLFRIATNLVKDGVRRRRRRPEDTGHDVDGPSPASNDAIDNRLDVTGAMSRLRHRDRAMLWLAYAQGASHEEIGRVVGVKTSSVKPLLYRARQRLARLLGRGEAT